jgi:DNA repair protein RadA/Sms
VETVEESQKAKGKGQSFNSKVIKLSDVEIDENRRISTGEGELDSVLGGGMVPGMVTLIAGEPGIGKSTLLTQVALNNTSNEVLYVCGEESASQVALRVKRLETLNSKSKIINLLLFEFGDVDEVVAKI